MTTHTMTDRVVWVTGASRGLGRGMVEALVDAGATVAASARSANDLDALVADLPQRSCRPYPLDVTDEAAVDAAVERIVSELGGLDGAVSCAGVSPAFTRVSDLDVSTWRDVIDINLTGTFLCARAAGRVFVEQGSGSLVTISSVHATQGFECISAYAASKGGVEALTRVLAAEWAPHGVRANVVAPGYYDTDLSHGLLESRWGDRIRERTMLGRTGEAHELAGSVVHLLSDAASYVTGTTLTVDGGWTAW